MKIIIFFTIFFSTTLAYGSDSCPKKRISYLIEVKGDKDSLGSENNLFKDAKSVKKRLIEKNYLDKDGRPGIPFNIKQHDLIPDFWRAENHYDSWFLENIDLDYTTNFTLWYRSTDQSVARSFKNTFKKFDPARWGTQQKNRPEEDFWASFVRFLSIPILKRTMMKTSAMHRKLMFTAFVNTIGVEKRGFYEKSLLKGAQRFSDIIWKRFQKQLKNIPSIEFNFNKNLKVQVETKLFEIKKYQLDKLTVVEQKMLELNERLLRDGLDQETTKIFMDALKLYKETLLNGNSDDFTYSAILRSTNLTEQTQKLFKGILGDLHEVTSFRDVEYHLSVLRSSGEFIDYFRVLRL